MLKDERLDWLARQGANVARFFSVSPKGEIRFCRIKGQKRKPKCVDQVIKCFLKEVPAVSIRTFYPQRPDGNPFDFNVVGSDNIRRKIAEYNKKGLFVIVNEGLEKMGGMISGVLFGDLVEFVPSDTPRGVDDKVAAQLPREIGFQLIKKVFNFHFSLPFASNWRIEFSVYPFHIGYFGANQVIWQAEEYDKKIAPVAPQIFWPNPYSKEIGDKCYGILIADILGFPVPKTTVISKKVPLFFFGSPVNQGEPCWVRTAPIIQTPGKFQTKRGWIDPFEMMMMDDPESNKIASVIVQDGIRAVNSGACLMDQSGKLIIEGCNNYGDEFMVGNKSTSKLSARVLGEVGFIYERLMQKLGDVRFEWVFDGKKVWVVQLHVGKSVTFGNTIFPGNPEKWIDFQTDQGLEALREVINMVKNNEGIVLHGKVGLTSHFGDVLRKAEIPSKLVNR